MHEMGIAGSILDAVGKEMRRYPKHRAVKVRVRIGSLAGVDRDSLRFCFEAMVKDTPMGGLELGIEEGSGDELDLCSMELDDEEAA